VVIAGTLQGVDIPAVQGPVRGLSTAPLYVDFQLHSAGEMTVDVPQGHNALLYVYAGEATIAGQTLSSHVAAILEDGDELTVQFTAGSRFLLLSAKPIGEPVVQYGPFVMNSVAEIEQAIRDYQQGKLTDGAAATKVFA
jgi:redox-sensitive bicupin YhaK (pirin superfamily)